MGSSSHWIEEGEKRQIVNMAIGMEENPPTNILIVNNILINL